MPADRFIDTDIFPQHLLRLSDHGLANLLHVAAGLLQLREPLPHPPDRPEEIGGGGACGSDGRRSFFQRVLQVADPGGRRLTHSQRQAHGRRDADGRRPADHHGADGLRHLAVIVAGDVDLLAWQPCLVDQHHARFGPLDRLHHFVVCCS